MLYYQENRKCKVIATENFQEQERLTATPMTSSEEMLMLNISEKT